MKVLGVIPARYQSSRFPGKPLVQIEGKTMIERVYQQALKADTLQEVVVATDHAGIFDQVHQFGGKAMMTNPNHTSGTGRCREVAEQYPDFEYVINIQGDEPFIQPSQIDLVASTLINHPEASIATLAKTIHNTQDLLNENVVKVVVQLNGKALYFSRHPIPFQRNVSPSDWLQKGQYFKHIGLYGFRRETLIEVTQLTEGFYYQLESLEQLQWLENGYDIYVQLTEEETFGIDTPEDLEKAVAFLKNNG